MSVIDGAVDVDGRSMVVGDTIECPSDYGMRFVVERFFWWAEGIGWFREPTPLSIRRAFVRFDGDPPGTIYGVLLEPEKWRVVP